MDKNPLVYEYSIGKRKPYDYDYGNRQGNQNAGCPFCNVQHLVDIYEKDGDKIWLIKKGTQYVRSVLSHGVDSYNLFFYPINDGKGTCCKIIPRFYASPYFVGYKISQVDDSNTLKWEAERVKGFVNGGILH